MNVSTAKKRRLERIAIRSQKKKKPREDQKNIPNSEGKSTSPIQPNRVSPNILSDITNEHESPRMKQMRIIKETKAKRKNGESSSASRNNLDENVEEAYMAPHFESRNDNPKVAPSKDHASSSRSLNSLYNPEVYDDNGDATYSCEHCGALMWYNGRIDKRSKKSNPKFSLCCMHGKIDLPLSPEPPQKLKDLMFKGDEKSKNFMENIIPYNSMFAFTSMGGPIDTSVNKGRGPNVYRLHGQNCHRIGSLLPPPGKSPKYNQLYIQDTENENQNRIDAFSEKRTCKLPKSKILRDDIVEDIKNMLNKFNPYSKILRTTKDRAQSGKTYNLPTTLEVAALYVGDFDLEMEPKDIVLEIMEGKLKRIIELHAGYLPLQYPLLFPFGEDGYHIDLELKRTTT
ncbi:PREDICTED: uncharacterized protein LOC104715250 [Camelina sativa]|uniref:Uncharacterized protein LOC104715250 n=1 Tax=Camelina sativa TaxID=90675 RepID=A0ABM1QFF4_CAMSA|nr:PREDICTED: uncharacterized protein LOC104715250 [Camelina sativa]